MDFRATVIEGVLKWFISGKAFKEIVNLVEILMDEEATNDEKRSTVRANVMPLVKETGKWLLNTVIAYAVDKYKVELNEK